MYRSRTTEAATRTDKSARNSTLRSRTAAGTTTTVTAEEGITVPDRADMTRRAITLRFRLKAGIRTRARTRIRTASVIPTDRITAIRTITTSSISASRTRALRRDSSSTVSASPRISAQEN